MPVFLRYRPQVKPHRRWLPPGRAAAALVNKTVVADAGSYSLAGATTTAVLHKWKVDATTAASYALTGAATTSLLHAYKPAAVAGSYALAGAATTNVLHKWTVSAGTASYALTGNDVALTRLTNKSLVAGTASYAITGTAASVLHRWKPVAAAGSYSLTAKATDNAGGTQTSTAIPITVNGTGGPTSVSFQQGTNGYAGMVDAHIRSDATTTNYGGASTLLIDGKPDYSALLKWDLTAIPVGKTVTAVTLTFNVVAASSQVYELYALKRDWSESEVTWVKASSSVNWSTAGASNTTGDRETTVLGTISSPSTGIKTFKLNAAGIAKVQSWINAPSTNFGFVVQDYTVTKGLDVTSSEGGVVAQRPIITVTYQ